MRTQSKVAVAILLITTFSGTAAALDINSTMALQYYGDGNTLDFEVATDGTTSVQGDVDINTYNLDGVDNIYQDSAGNTNFFDSCSGNQVVTGISSDGTVSCISPEAEDSVEDLSTTLEAGNNANQSIDMQGNDLLATDGAALRGFVAGYGDVLARDTLLPSTNSLAYADKRGTVTQVRGGSAEEGTKAAPFDNIQGWQRWEWKDNSDFPVEINIKDLGQTDFLRTCYVDFQSGTPDSVTIETHDPDDNSWNTFYSVSGNTDDNLFMENSQERFDEINLTLDNGGSGDVGLVEFACTSERAELGQAFLSRSGESMFGDIDMNSNDINSINNLGGSNIVNSDNINSGAVTSSEISDGTITTSDLDTSDVDDRYLTEDSDDTMSGSLDVSGNLTFGSNGYGQFFDTNGGYQTFSSAAGNDVVIRNQEGGSNQYIFLGDSSNSASSTILGVGHNSNQILDLKGNGNLDMTGNLNMGSNRVQGLADPDSGDDAFDRDYGDDRYLTEDSADTMSGSLTVNGELDVNNRLNTRRVTDTVSDAGTDDPTVFLGQIDPRDGPMIVNVNDQGAGEGAGVRFYISPGYGTGNDNKIIAFGENDDYPGTLDNINFYVNNVTDTNKEYAIEHTGGNGGQGLTLQATAFHPSISSPSSTNLADYTQETVEQYATQSYVDSNVVDDQNLEEVLESGASAGDDDINMNNQNINNLASIDNGGGVIGVNDKIQLSTNSIGFSNTSASNDGRKRISSAGSPQNHGYGQLRLSAVGGDVILARNGGYEYLRALRSGNVEIPNGNLDVGGPSNTGAALNVGGQISSDGVITAFSPGSSPSGSQARFSSPSGNIGVVLEHGDGAGGVSRRWDLRTDGSDTLDIHDDTDAEDILKINQNGNINVPNGQVVIEDNGDSAGSEFLRIGDDSYFTDVDYGNRVGLYGVGDSSIGQLKLGSSGAVIAGDSSGNVNINTGNLDLSGSRIERVADPDSGDDAFDRDYGDDRYLTEDNSDSLSGDLEISGTNDVDGSSAPLEVSETGGDTLFLGGNEIDSLDDSLYLQNNNNNDVIVNSDLNFDTNANIQSSDTNVINFDGSQNVEIPNGNLGLSSGNEIRLKSVGDSGHYIRYNSTFDGVDIGGWKGVRLFDVENNQEILRAENPGNVEVPNGYLDMTGGNIQMSGNNINQINNVNFNGGGDSTGRIIYPSEGGSDEIIIDNPDGTGTVTRFTNSGNVEIPNGNLDLDTNDIEGDEEIQIQEDLVASDSLLADRVIAKETWSAGNNNLNGDLGTWSFSSSLGGYSPPDPPYGNRMAWDGDGTVTLTSPGLDLKDYSQYDPGDSPSDTESLTETRTMATAYVLTTSMDSSAEYMELQVNGTGSWETVYRTSSNEDSGPAKGWEKMKADITPYIDQDGKTHFRFRGTGGGPADNYAVGRIYIHESDIPTRLGGFRLGENEVEMLQELNLNSQSLTNVGGTSCSDDQFIDGNGECESVSSAGGTDEKVSVASDETAGYLGTGSGDGVLRTDSTLDYTDNGANIELGASSSLAGNELSLSGGSLDVDEGDGSGLNADDLDGLDRDEFAANRRTFDISSNSGTEYFRIANLTDNGGNFDEFRFSAYLYGSVDQGAGGTSATRKLVASGRDSNYDINSYIFGGRNYDDELDFVVTYRQPSAGDNRYYLYLRADDYVQGKLVVEGGFMPDNEYDFTSGLSQSDLSGNVIHDSSEDFSFQSDDSNFNISQGNLVGVGGTQCGDDEFLDGDGQCETVTSAGGGTEGLETTLETSNSAGDDDIDMSNQNINDLNSIDGNGNTINIEDNLGVGSNSITSGSGALQMDYDGGPGTNNIRMDTLNNVYVGIDSNNNGGSEFLIGEDAANPSQASWKDILKVNGGDPSVEVSNGELVFPNTNGDTNWIRMPNGARYSQFGSWTTIYGYSGEGSNGVRFRNPDGPGDLLTAEDSGKVDIPNGDLTIGSGSSQRNLVLYGPNNNAVSSQIEFSDDGEGSSGVNLRYDSNNNKLIVYDDNEGKNIAEFERGEDVRIPNGNLNLNGNAVNDVNSLSTQQISDIVPFFLQGHGNNNAEYSGAQKLSIGGNQVFSSSCRGLRLVAIKKSDYSVVNNTCYDTFSSTSESNQMANSLSALGEDHIGFIASHDAWESDVTSSLENQFYRLGLYKAYNAVNNDIRKPYAAVFEPASADKNGSRATEVIADEDGDQPLARVSGFLMDGSYVAQGSKQATLTSSQGQGIAVSTDNNANVRIPNGNLDLEGNNINGIGGLNGCSDNQYVDGVGDCESISSGTDDQTLEEVLESGSSAGDDNLDMNDQTITNINTAVFKSAGSGSSSNAQIRYANSGNELEIVTSGGSGADNQINIVGDQDNQDIARFYEGSENVEVPNGDLGVGANPSVGEIHIDGSGGAGTSPGLFVQDPSASDDYGAKFTYDDNNDELALKVRSSGTDNTGLSIDRDNSDVGIPNGDLRDGSNNVVYDQSNNYVPKERIETLTSSEIGSGAVTSSEISDGSVSTSDLDTSSVDSRYVQESESSWGVISLETGDYQLWNGSSGTVSIPSVSNTNCSGGVCVRRDSNNRFTVQFPLNVGFDEDSFPGASACHGVSAGDNEIDNENWGSGVRSVVTDHNGHGLSDATGELAAAYIYDSSTNSHDTYGVVCNELD